MTLSTRCEYAECSELPGAAGCSARTPAGTMAEATASRAAASAKRKRGYETETACAACPVDIRVPHSPQNCAGLGLRPEATLPSLPAQSYTDYPKQPSWS